MKNKIAEVTERLPEVSGIMDHWVAIIVGIVIVCTVGWMVWKKTMKKGK
tara:strand:- start:124 stop:270 length:147 start_codon:yes stop_codon:yes gene_type:complete